MRRSIGRLGSSVLELLLPTTKGEACTEPYCQASGTKRRCCKVCSGGVVACTPWITGKCVTGACPVG